MWKLAERVWRVTDADSLISVVTGSLKNGTTRYRFTKLCAGQDETGRDIHVASSAGPRPVFHTFFENFHRKAPRRLPAEFSL
jgi:hypothetical protein